MTLGHRPTGVRGIVDGRFPAAPRTAPNPPSLAGDVGPALSLIVRTTANRDRRTPPPWRNRSRMSASFAAAAGFWLTDLVESMMRANASAAILSTSSEDW